MKKNTFRYTDYIYQIIQKSILSQKGNNIQNDNEVEKGISSDDQKDNKENAANKPKGEEPKYTPEFYIKKIPKSKEAVDELIKDRNFAYYQLGVIYKEKFKEYYKENKDVILGMYQLNKESYIEKVKVWQEKNKEKLIGYAQKYRDCHKEKLNCSCGGVYSALNKKLHCSTKNTSQYHKSCFMGTLVPFERF